MSKDWTEAEIAAFVDGELEGERAAAVRAAIARDPGARRLAEEIAEANRLMRAAFDAPMGEEVPPAIADAISAAPATVIGFRPRARRAGGWAPAALAAGVALAIGFALGHPGSGDGDVRLSLGLAQGALHAALDAQPSGAVGPGGVATVATYRAASGLICREFETGGAAWGEAGLACRGPGGHWRVEILVAQERDQAAGASYAPAEGASGDALAAMLDRLGAGPALPADEEAALLATGGR
jgi:hypothetical protein